MNDDILNRIDETLESMERNAARFDPFGPEIPRSVHAPLKSGTEEEAPERAEAAPPVPLVQCDTSPWVSFADVAVGPSGGGNPTTVDIRRRVQDGTAPVPDPVGEMLRAEVLRQGITECELDGVRWIYGGGQWSKSPYQSEPVSPLVDAVVEPDPDVPRLPRSLMKPPWWKPWRW